MTQPFDFMNALRRAAQTREVDTRADLYSEAMFAGLEREAPALAEAAETSQDQLALLLFMRAFPRPAWRPALETWQRSDDEPVRAAVAGALSLQPIEAWTMEQMRRAIEDPSTLVRSRAVRAMKSADSSTYTPLLETLATKDNDPTIRALAQAVLSAL